MISNLFKILLSLTTVSGCFYSIQVFGFNYGLLAALVVSFVIILSIFYHPIKELGKVLGNGICIISFLALAVLLLAGTIGGSFNLSPSNEIVAMFLFFTSLIGLTSFFWSVPSNENT